MGIFSDAFANTRLRARKSRLLGPGDLRRLSSERSASSLAAEISPESGGNPERASSRLFERLLEDYAFVMRAYPRAESLWRALLGIHEIENVKLGWRARTRDLPASVWGKLWRPLGRLESVRLADWSGTPSLREAVRSSAATPYAQILREVLEAHESDSAGAELALDRWAWLRVVDEGRRLSRSERDAARLLFAFVRDRDYDFLRRAHATGRVPAEGAFAGDVLIPEEEKPERLRAMASWTEGAGPFPAPPRLLPAAAPALGLGWDRFAQALSRRRRDQCLRAFRSYPFRLAPAVAFLLLREAEVRALSALLRGREAGGSGLPPARTLAGSLLEAG